MMRLELISRGYKALNTMLYVSYIYNNKKYNFNASFTYYVFYYLTKFGSGYGIRTRECHCERVVC